MTVRMYVKFVLQLFTGNCKIHEVRVEPCPEAEEDKPCKVKRGKSATIEFDYTTRKIIVKKMLILKAGID